MNQNVENDLRDALIQAVEASGFSISGPTDVRAAENGEPAWVCNARAALTNRTEPNPVQNIMGEILFHNFYLNVDFTVHQVKNRIDGINQGIALAKLLEILHENPTAEVLKFAAEVTQEYDDNSYYSGTRVDTFELLDANGDELPEFTINGIKYISDNYAGDEDLGRWDDDYEGLLMESPYYFEDLADKGLFRLERSKLAQFIEGKFDLDALLEAIPNL